ncbi:MAG: hypothetical protein IAE94_09585 [Chthoniobacterales bacterium]|nr:hypothetical protein [Chthoniobacterales bacterium]
MNITFDMTEVGYFGDDDKLIRNVVASIPQERLELEAEWAGKMMITYAQQGDGLNLEQVEYWNKYKEELKAKGEASATERRVSAVKLHIQNVIALHRYAGKVCGMEEMLKCDEIGGEDSDIYYRELIREALENIAPNSLTQLQDLTRLAEYFLTGGEVDSRGAEFAIMGNKTMSMVIKAYVKTISEDLV